MAYIAGNLSFKVSYELLDKTLAALGISFASRILKTHSISLNSAARRARELRKNDWLGEYEPSVLRETPFLESDIDHYTIPIPAIFPIVLADNFLLGYEGLTREHFVEVGKQFEDYCALILETAFEGLLAKSEQEYGPRRNRRKTPDVRVYLNNNLRCIIECKSQRISYDKKFRRQNDQDFDDRIHHISKGVFQIWRYVDDLIAGKHSDAPYTLSELTGYTVTLENWNSFEGCLRKIVLAEANIEADKASLSSRCRIPVSIVSISDLEHNLWSMSPENFIELPRLFENNDINYWEPSRPLGSSKVVRLKYRGDGMINHLKRALPNFGALLKGV